MARLKDIYRKKIQASLKESLGKKSLMAVPKLEKVIVSIGTGKALKDPKLLDTMTQNLKKISGQAPVKTLARVSISNFGIREGMTVGLKVTLRKERMYEFVDKLVNVTLPRVRDFQGIEKSGFDGKGNYSLGFKEHNVFPEIKSSDVEKLHGLQITVKTTASNDREGYSLLKELGFPFKK